MDINTALEYLNGNRKLDEDENRLMGRWKDVYYGISLHTTGACPAFRSLDPRGGNGYIYPPGYFGEEYQTRFEKFLFSKHPRENEHTRWWRFSQYKPMTRAPFLQIIEIVSGAIFQDSNYGIEIQDEEDSKYIWSNSFNDYDLVGWFANIGIPNIMEDPNGLIVRIPTKPYFDQKEERIEVKPIFVNSKDIIFFDPEEILIFKHKNHAFYIDRLTIFRFECDKGKYYLAPEDANGYYAHMFGRLPVDVAGGVWNTQGFYDSYLVKAKAAADEYVSSYSGEQMVNKEASHPFIIMANEECSECQGVGMVQEECDDCPDEEYKLVRCKVCHGKKTVSVSPGDRLSAPKEDMQHDLVKIVNPDVGINKHHHDTNVYIYQTILHALHLYKTDKAESGEAKAIDQERLYQFISKISNHLFDKLLYNTISDIIAYRNVGVINGVMMPINTPFTVQKPTQFQIKTAADLLDEYKTGTESNMPAFVRAKMVYDFVDKQYSGDPVMKKKASLIMELDDLAIRSEEEKMSMATFNEASKEDLIFSRKLPSILDTIIRENGEQWFLEADFDKVNEQVKILFAKIKPMTNFNPQDEIDY